MIRRLASLLLSWTMLYAIIGCAQDVWVVPHEHDLVEAQVDRVIAEAIRSFDGPIRYRTAGAQQKFKDTKLGPPVDTAREAMPELKGAALYVGWWDRDYYRLYTVGPTRDGLRKDYQATFIEVFDIHGDSRVFVWTELKEDLNSPHYPEFDEEHSRQWTEALKKQFETLDKK